VPTFPFDGNLGIGSQAPSPPSGEGVSEMYSRTTTLVPLLSGTSQASVDFSAELSGIVFGVGLKLMDRPMIAQNLTSFRRDCK